MSSPYSGAPAPTSPVASAAPRTVTIAFWLFMLAVLAHVVGIVISVTQIPAARSRAESQLARTDTHGIDVNGVLTGTFIAAIVIGVLYVIAFIVFDLFMRRGANWARIVLLIVTVLSLTGVAGAFGVGAVGVLAAVVAVVLTFLPASNAYFHAVRDRKRGATQ